MHSRYRLALRMERNTNNGHRSLVEVTRQSSGMFYHNSAAGKAVRRRPGTSIYGLIATAWVPVYAPGAVSCPGRVRR